MRSTNMFRRFNDIRKTTHAAQQEDTKYILVADENSLEGKVLGEYLENLGYSVKNVVTGTEALKLIQSSSPMLVISSLNMPEVHGYQLCQILKGDPKTVSIPFMMISSGDEPPDKAMGYQQGCDDYITTPLDPSELKSRVEALLRRSKQYDQIKFASNLQSAAAARKAIKSELSHDSDKVFGGFPEASAGVFKTVTEENGVAAEELPSAPKAVKPPAFTLPVSQQPDPAGLTFDRRDVEMTPSAPITEKPKPSGQESIRDSVEIFRASMAGTSIKPKPVFDDSVTGAETPPAKPDQPSAAGTKPLQKVQPVKPPPPTAKEAHPAATVSAPAAEDKTADPAVAAKPPAPAKPVGKEQPAAEKPAPVSKEVSEKEEAVEISIDKIAPEAKLKSQLSVSLNLPARKDILHADAKALYDYGHEIITVLQNAGGNFGADDFLIITTYCDKLAEVATASNELLSMALGKETEPSLATHSVNSSIIALRIGKNLQIQAGELSLLGAAALLLDLGMIKVNPKILNKSGGLTDSERKKVQEHVNFTLSFIEKAIKDEFPQECRYMTTSIYQHHERQEGQGYPQNLTGDKISRAGKILGIADTYEAMCHTRFHRSRQTTYRALQEVVGMKKTFFDPIILRALVNELTFFPIGCYVRLNTEEIGIVIDVSPVHSMRPKVKILADSDGAPLDFPKEVDLVQSPFLYVVKPLEDEDIPELV